jgi:hypothetical protein
VFLIIVRCWRILRVFHGAWEARNKAEASVMDVQEEIRTVVDFSLYSLVLSLHQVEQGDMRPEDFVKNFKRVFGNEQNPKHSAAERGVGRNYIGPIERDIEKSGGKNLHGTSRHI